MTVIETAVLDVLNPVDGSVLGSVPVTDPEQVAGLVVRSKAAQQSWAGQPRHHRAEVMCRFSALVEREIDRLALLLCRETGKLLWETTLEIQATARLYRRFAEHLLSMAGEARFGDGNPGLETDLVVTRRDPYGVMVAICPFNYPAEMFAHKSAPALAMGNSVILKPSEETPLTAVELSILLREAGLPEDVLLIAVGGPEVGDALTSSPDVRLVSFTGSTAVGFQVAAACAETFKHAVLELGGNDAFIVLPDADLDLAVGEAVFGRSLANGQVCCANKRLLVHRSIRQEFTDRLAAAFGALSTGDPTDSETTLGPVISSRAAARISEQVSHTVAEGARLLIGGAVDGAFVRPTILDGVTPDMAVGRNAEIFGPVISIMTFDDEGEAVRLTNGTRYGLAASVFTRDVSRGLRLATLLDTGSVVVNGSGLYRTDDYAWGGRRDSGQGKEGLTTSLEEYSQLQSVVLRRVLA